MPLGNSETFLNAAPDAEARSEIEAVLSFPGAYGNLAALLVTVAGLAAAAWAGTIAGSEWSWNTFRLAVARGESRSRYVTVTLGTIGLLLAVAWLVLFTIGLVFAAAGGAIAGVDLGDPFDPSALERIPVIVAAGWWTTVLYAAIGFAVAFIARTQVAGIVSVVGLYFGEQFAAVIVPADLLRFAPITASAGLVAEANRLTVAPDLLLPLLATSAYVVIAAVAVAVYAQRAEVP